MATVYYLVGPPACGKRTVALELASLTGAAVIDNHLINDPVFTAIGANGRDPLPEIALRLAHRVRRVVLEAAELAPPALSHILTNCLADIPSDHSQLASIRNLATTRGARFVPVWMTCDTAELIRRVTLPERTVRNKLRDADALRGLLGRIDWMSPPADAIVLDTAALTPAEAASAIRDHAGPEPLPLWHRDVGPDTYAAAMGSSTPSHGHHTLDYLELFAKDLTKAKDFYARALGWEFTDYGPDYAGLRTADGHEFGGLTTQATRPDSTDRATPWVFIYSADLDATLASVVSAIAAVGGQITVAPFEFPGGRRFMFADLYGNVLGVWSAG